MTFSNRLWNEKYNQKWALIPSDPGTCKSIMCCKGINLIAYFNIAVFDDMIKEYNVKNAKVQEVLTLDFEDLTREGYKKKNIKL